MIPVVAAFVLGQIATFPNLAPWYAWLVKPAFNPPNWVFGPVWTMLYVWMVFAVWRVLRFAEKNTGSSSGLELVLRSVGVERGVVVDVFRRA